MKITFSLLLILFAVNLSIAQEDAKKMTPPEGKALVYFLRPSKLGTMIPFTITYDDKLAGQMRGNRFIYSVIEPGNHKIITTGGEKDAMLDLTMEANKTYFVELIPKMGVVLARVKMELMTEEEGRLKLEKCRYITEK